MKKIWVCFISDEDINEKHRTWHKIKEDKILTEKFKENKCKKIKEDYFSSTFEVSEDTKIESIKSILDNLEDEGKILGATFTDENSVLWTTDYYKDEF